MRILHTSDWHLGQLFFEKTRESEHRQFMSWLLDVIKEQEIDTLIVAGDIFDTCTPPSYAREMYNQFVDDIQDANCKLVLLGGNHDSVAVLNETKQLLARLNTTVVASTGLEKDEQVFVLTARDSRPGAILCAVPFIRPRDVAQSQAGESGVEKRQAIGQAIKEHYAALYELALAKRVEVGEDLPIIATGHLTAIGVTSSESVRDIYVGTLEAYPAAHFPPADYIALGHIHRPQIVNKTEHIRYCGSPIPMSFDELSSQKQVVMVEFDAYLTRTITPIDVPLFQPMVTIKGDLSKIEQDLIGLHMDDGIPVWVSANITSEEYYSDLQQRLQKLVEDKNVEILHIRRSKSEQRLTLAQARKETLAELTPLDVFEKRLDLIDSSDEESIDRLTRIRETFNQILSEVEHEKENA